MQLLLNFKSAVVCALFTIAFCFSSVTSHAQINMGNVADKQNKADKSDLPDNSDMAPAEQMLSICYKRQIREVPMVELKRYLRRGTPVDMDGDGFFHMENYCGSEVDPNDYDPDVIPEEDKEDPGHQGNTKEGKIDANRSGIRRP